MSRNNFFVNMSAEEYRQAMGLSIPRRSPEPEKKNKYGAHKTEADGFVFDSKKESVQWLKFRRMEEAGVIRNLKRQTELPFILKGKKMFVYKPDMEYDDDTGHHYVDVKSPATITPVFKLKKRIIETEYGITIEII